MIRHYDGSKGGRVSASKAKEAGFLIDNGYLRMDGYGCHTRLHYTGKPVENQEYRPSERRTIDYETTKGMDHLHLLRMLGYWERVLRCHDPCPSGSPRSLWPGPTRIRRRLRSPG